MSEEARALVVVGTEITRFRGAPQVTTLDIALAFALVQARPHGELFADARSSPSPQMLEFAPVLAELLSGTDEVGVEDLRRVSEPAREAVRRAVDVEDT
ncbi:hypothetical protein CCE02nite_32840 [Cellulosimicrobium cellulans]|uniref:Uncharacterized protein n=1 Tax=Cellulosimicrobium cellulans TaxID=1710 RepID=A0A4Y4E5S1_CELCE|nr:hypothetical protein CCE02nite_32840 [Cellulosimicrobium cellulans]